MDVFVVDVSAVVPNLVTEAYTPASEAMFRQFTAGHSFTLACPEFGRLECANVLWKRVRFHGLPEAEATLLMENLLSLPFTIYGIDGLFGKALEIALRHKIAMYDSVYIALAKDLGYPLITIDQKQATAALAEGVTLKPLTDFVSESPSSGE